MCLFYREQIAVFKDYSLNHMYKSKNAAKHENLTDYKASHIRGKEQWRLWFPTKSQKNSKPFNDGILWTPFVAWE